MASAGCRKNAGVPVLVERRGDLAADDARLAHAGEDDAAAAVAEQLDRAVEPARRAGRRARGSPPLRFRAPCGRARDQPCSAHLGGCFTMASIAISRRSSGSSRSRRSAFCASLLARDGSVVHLEKHAVDAGGDARRCQRLDVLRQARRHAVAAARQLQAVRDVEDDRDAQLAHDRKRAHVHDEVVIAEARAALGHDDARVARLDDLGDRVLHVVGREELALLDVDDAAGLRGGRDEVGLPREERRNLQHVGDVGGRRAPATASWMSVRIGTSSCDLIAARMRKPLVEARAAERSAATCGSPCRTTP